ncbi:hypothetical protein JCM5296_003569, partial [Sporobolomyces johnsonii]
PYSPASNGVAERVNRSILEGIRAMLHQAGADKSLWAEALLAFVFVKNRSPHAALKGKVPLSVWRDHPVRVDMLRVWGCRAWHTLANTKSKLDARAIPLVFVGYEGDTKVYRLLDPASKRIVRSRDARFQEDLFPLASPSPPAAAAILTVNRIDAAPIGPLTPAPAPPATPAAPARVPAPHLFVTPPPQPVFEREAAPSPESPDPLDFLSDPFVAQAVALTAAVDEDLGAHDEAFSLPSRDPRNHREALVDVESAGWLDGEKGEFLSLLNDYKLLGELGHPLPSPLLLRGDNQGANALARDPQFHDRTRHLRLTEHFVREMVTQGMIDVRYIPTSLMVADLFTKSLPLPAFLGHRSSLGLRPLERGGVLQRDALDGQTSC